MPPRLDCDDVILLLAREGTLSGSEVRRHVESCEPCRRLASELGEDGWQGNSVVSLRELPARWRGSGR